MQISKDTWCCCLAPLAVIRTEKGNHDGSVMAVAQAGRQMRCGCTQHHRPYIPQKGVFRPSLSPVSEGGFLPAAVLPEASLVVQHGMSVDVSRPRQDLFADIVKNQGFEIECMLSPILLFHGTLQQHCEL